MATITTTVHEKTCDRCGDKCPKDKPRCVIQFDGVAAIDDGQTCPTALDLCKDCTKSAILWWTGPKRREAKEGKA